MPTTIQIDKDTKKNFIDLFLDTSIFNENSSILLYGHHLINTEIYYIVCRKKNKPEAEKILHKLDKTISTISEKWLFDTGAN